MTESARNHEEAMRMRVIVIPREVFPLYHPLPWDQVEAAAFAGTDGLAPLIVAALDAPDPDLAFVRPARKDDRSLQGRTLLYRQGWGRQ